MPDHPSDTSLNADVPEARGAAWRSIEDLRAPLAELERHYAAGDYDRAALILDELDFDYLRAWGHYELLVQWYERLYDKVRDPQTRELCAGYLAMSYQQTGQTRRAMEMYEQALALARQAGNEEAAGTLLGNLGLCYANLGQIERAIECHQQALAVDRALNDRGGESSTLMNLANRYADLGQLERAVETYRQALAIARELGDRLSEASALSGLGARYISLGQFEQAIQCHQQALALDRKTGNRYGLCVNLGNAGLAHLQQGDLAQARPLLEQARVIGDEIGYRQIQNVIRGFEGALLLAADEPAAAQARLEEARALSYPTNDAVILLLLGMALMRQGKPAQAAQAWREAATQCEALLAESSEMYELYDTLAVAHAGMSLVNEGEHVQRAAWAFAQARAITRAPGAVAWALQLLAGLGNDDRLAGLRQAAGVRSETDT